MSKQTATGESRVIAEGFIAYRAIDQDEGRGGEQELERFTTVEEAIDRAKGQGVFGQNGSVSRYETILYSGGLIETVEEKLIGSRLTPDRGWQVGWIDLREYAGN